MPADQINQMLLNNPTNNNLQTNHFVKGSLIKNIEKSLPLRAQVSRLEMTH